MNECVLRPFVDPSNEDQQLVQLEDPLYRVKIQEENPDLQLKLTNDELDYPVQLDVEVGHSDFQVKTSPEDESTFQLKIQADQPVKLDLEPECRRQQNGSHFIPASPFNTEIRCRIDLGESDRSKTFPRNNRNAKNISSYHFRRNKRVQPLYFGPKILGGDFNEIEKKNKKSPASTSRIGCCNVFAKSLHLTFRGENLREKYKSKNDGLHFVYCSLKKIPFEYVLKY
jgi:hypothetical protein